MKTKLFLPCATVVLALTSCTDSGENAEMFPTQAAETIVSQEEMQKGMSVINEKENREATGVTASIQLPANTQVTGNTIDPFSVKVLNTTEGEQDGLVLHCEADGAVFSKPAVVHLFIPDADGLDLECVSEDGQEVFPLADIGSGKFEAHIPHFSDWNVTLNADAVSTTKAGEEKSTRNISVKAPGTVTVKYMSKTGAVWTGGTKSTVVTNYLKTKVGKYVVRNMQATFDVEEAGTYYYTVHQPYVDHKYRSGKATFSARVYSTAYIGDFGRRVSTGIGDGGGTR